MLFNDKLKQAMSEVNSISFTEASAVASAVKWDLEGGQFHDLPVDMHQKSQQTWLSAYFYDVPTPLSS